MESLYLKNYKGFEEQFVQIADVTFLVGENSTGKTSILKIIDLLSSQEFWNGAGFNTNDIELGYFDEILTKKSKEKTFKIGIEKNSSNLKDADVPISKRRILIEFHEEKSVPRIKSIISELDDYKIELTNTPKQIRFRTKKKFDQSFEEWVNDTEFTGKKRILKLPHVGFPLPVILSFLNFQLGQEKKPSLFLIGSFELFDHYKSLAPIRAKAKRIYESYRIKFSPEGDHVPSMLRQMLSEKKTGKRLKAIKILEAFGKDSNLFDKIEIKELGRKGSSPFEIFVKYKNVEVKLPNVGYGVSQSLPIVIEILSNTDTCFSIQQPEVHLHPKAQAALGSFLFNAANNDANRFLIETHSDFMINRFRYKLSSKEHKKEISSRILFFERIEGKNKITEIQIGKKGRYETELPESYRDFFIDEQLNTLEI